MKCLVLFSGTGSVEFVFKEYGIECRGVDINNKFKPYYNVDILKWDYQKVIDEWEPDIIHSSFVCSEFSKLKSHLPRDLDKGYALLNRSLNIIEYAQSRNPEFKAVLENPVSPYVREHKRLNKLKRVEATYCKYGFWYKKPTYFWYTGFKLVLKKRCSKSNPCESILSNPNGNCHMVGLGYGGNGKIICHKYFKQLRKIPEYKGYTDREFRYRIPQLLLHDVVKCILA